MSSPTLVFFRKELKDAFRNRLLLLLIAGLGVIVILSVVVAAAAFHAKVVDYQDYVQAMRNAGMGGSVTAPQLFPLQLLRGAIEYLEIVGSIVAIIIGYTLVAKEKNRGTIRLLFSRPVSGASMAAGKLLAMGGIWLAVIAVLGAIMLASVSLMGGISVSAGEIAKLVLVLAFSWMHLVMWTAFSYWVAGRRKRLSTALVIGLIVWLVVVLIVPQIGDTMDPDNQVTGGLFRGLQVAKPQEQAVMAHFSGYEATRNFLEETSISKHYERAGFAYLGVKDKYNQQPLGLISRDMWANVTWLLGGLAAAVGLAVMQSKKRYLLRKA